MNKNLLIILIAAALGFFWFAGCEQNSNARSNSDKSAQMSADEQSSTQIIAYYFHPRFRCPTCTMIEAMAKQAVEEHYTKEIAADRIVWVPINIDEPDNEEFVKTFNLQTSTLVIAEMELDKLLRWKKLEEVWKLVDNRDKFVEYVTKEIDQYLQN
jgi:PBP1b-binding outer membrane lipoprotein LpoB